VTTCATSHVPSSLFPQTLDQPPSQRCSSSHSGHFSQVAAVRSGLPALNAHPVFFFFKPMTRFETLKSLASLSPAAVLTRHTLVLERKKKKNRLIRARRCRSTKKSAKPHYPAYRELESWSRPCIIQPVQMHNKVSTFIYPLISLMFQLLLSDVWKCWRFVQLPT